MDDINRNGWTECVGTGGRLRLEWVVEMARNTHLIDQLQHELGFVLFNHTATRGDELAEHAREEGILL